MPTPTKAINTLISLIFSKSPSTRGTVLFPRAGGKRRKGGSGLSACAALFLGFCSSAQANPPSAAEQVDRAVRQYIQSQVEAYAAEQDWQEQRFTYNSSVLSGGTQDSPCSEPLRVSGDGLTPLNRQRLHVSCDTAEHWQVQLSVLVTVSVPAVFSSRVIERGQTIKAEHLKLMPLDVGKAQRGFFHRPEEVVGQGAKRRIRAEQALSPGLLAAPLLVRRGEQVRILAEHDGIAASTLGEALGNGARGAVIRVRNLSSRKVIDSKVLDKGVVSSTFR